MSESINLSLIAKQIAHESNADLDFEGLDKIREVITRAGAKWPSDGMRVLKEKNQPLLDKLFSLESHLDSLILISNKPALLKKDFKAKLQEYEAVIGMCVDYVGRHLEN
jgi:hypothetical protein